MGRSALPLIILCLLLNTQFISPQSADVGPNTKLNVGSHYGITPEESVFLQNQKHPKNNIPAELLAELDEAKRTENYEKLQELNEIILSKYSPDVRVVGTKEFQKPEDLPVPDLNTYDPGQNDWLNNDVQVDTGATLLGFAGRCLELKYGDDGNMYLAHIYNQSDYRGIRVFRSTNGGASWSNIGGIYYPSLNRYIMNISMLVDKRANTNDSTRVIVYYTSATDFSNNNSNLSVFTLNPATNNYLIKTIDNAPSAREFNYVSAVSDGKYYDAATYIGCIVGDYSSDSDSTYNVNLYQSINWGETHSMVSMPFAASGWRDLYLSASLLPSSSFTLDSVMFASQRDFGYPGLRVFVTDWSTLTSDFRTIFLTSGGNYEKPVIAIKQGTRGVNKDIIITCTYDSAAVYQTSGDGGGTWGLNYVLDQRSPAPKTTLWTNVTSDSMVSSGDFMAAYSSITLDSINVRRGVNGSLGGTLYKQNSMTTTGTNSPVCAIYRDGSNMPYSTFAYWGFGPEDVYFDNETLVTGVENSEESVTSFALIQNYPNPFNPSTKIKFNLPEASNVSLKVYDVLGNEIAKLVNGNIESGIHEVQFNSEGLASGIYFYRLEANEVNGNSKFVDVKKMILLK